MASSTVDIYGFTKATTEVINASSLQETPVLFNSRGDLLATQSLPERTEIVRLGRSYSAQIAAANAFTYVAALPTTRAELVLFNAAAVGGVSIVIDRVWLYGVTSMGAAQPIVILGQVAATGLVAAPVDGTTTIVQTGLNGHNAALARLGVALFALANTAFALANHWQVIGNGLVSAPTTNLGAAIEGLCYGRYIIPPTAAFCVNAVAGTAAGTAVMGIDYHEVQIANA